MYGLGLPLAIQKNESVDSDPLVDGIENEMTLTLGTVHSLKFQP